MTDSVKVSVNTKELEDLRALFQSVARQAAARIAARGVSLLRKEVPRDKKNLYQGITQDRPRESAGRVEIDLIASAVNERRGARTGKVHYPSGNTKEVRLKPRPAFDYAETVAKGRKAIRPKSAKVLLIPVSTVPTGEAYITSGGQTFVMRRQAKAVPANPYDKRALEILDREAETIVDAALKKAGVLS